MIKNGGGKHRIVWKSVVKLQWACNIWKDNCFKTWAYAKLNVCNCPLNIKLGDFKVVRLFFCYFIGDFNQLTSEWPSYITITVTYCKFKILTSRVI